MIRPKALVGVLNHGNGNGVTLTMVVDEHGEAVAVAGDAVAAKSIAPVAAKARAAMECAATGTGGGAGAGTSGVMGGAHATGAPPAQLFAMTVTLAEGIIHMQAVGRAILCMQADKTASIPIIQHKAQILSSYLEEPLSEWLDPTTSSSN
ncbi:hypothetical protein Pelo_8601 [Pelomyxa schiedti]|nr:hypothetical protein Pelo_8601 [Pelomyxa schiedti]